MKKIFFGTMPTGESSYLYTLENDSVSLTLLDFGARIQSFRAFGTEIVGGYGSLDGYIADTSNQGATIGRVANRIANAKLIMDGKEYSLTRNSDSNCIHGGVGFDRKLWSLADAGEDFVKFTYTSRDGEEGFPSNLVVNLKFTLSGSAVIMNYEAIPDGKTPIALTNHAYFNLDGFGGTIDNHIATIYADRYSVLDENAIPTGERPEVLGTVFDFLTPHNICERTDENFVGYDHNFILSPVKYECFSGKDTGLAAEVTNNRLKLSVYTDQPGVQFYIANALGLGANDPLLRDGIKPIVHGAFCLEAQTEPNCVNHGEGIYNKGELYTQTTVYKVDLL